MNSVSNSLSGKQSDFGDESIFTTSINHSSENDSIQSGGEFTFDDISITEIKDNIEKINNQKDEKLRKELEYKQTIEKLENKLKKQAGGNERIKMISDLCSISYDEKNLDNTLDTIYNKVNQYKNEKNINNQNINNLSKILSEKKYKDNFKKDISNKMGGNKNLEKLYDLQKNTVDEINNIKKNLSTKLVGGTHIDVNNYKERYNTLISVKGQIEKDINKLEGIQTVNNKEKAHKIINKEMEMVKHNRKRSNRKVSGKKNKYRREYDKYYMLAKNKNSH